MNQVLQSGQVTPGHLASWTTDGVVQDSGVSIGNTYATFRADVLNVNFNATNQDYPVTVNLPAGYTRWRAANIFVSGASGTLTTATCGVFTQAGASGVPIVTSGTALTINTNLSDTNNNFQSFTVNNQNTLSYNDTTVYFRVQNPQGVAATANFTLIFQPLP